MSTTTIALTDESGDSATVENKSTRAMELPTLGLGLSI